MPAFLVRANLSRGDLRLFLSNVNGYAQDAASVLWTVYDIAGNQVSGRSLPAIRAAVGEYYAPWASEVRNGNYRIRWEITEDFSSPPRVITMPFFVVDPSSYQCSSNTCADGVPLVGGWTLLSGTTAGRGDLPLFLKDSNGVPANGFAVMWTIYDAAGNAMSQTQAASQAAYGEYFAPWAVNAQSGEYTVKWQFQLDQNSPLQSASMPFSVINPSIPFQPATVQPVCSSANAPMCGCGTPVIVTRLLSNCIC